MARSSTAVKAPTGTSEQRLHKARQLWKTFSTSRAELAKLLYQERKARRSDGGRGKLGFNSWLEKAGIPRATAYRLIIEHEVLIGKRRPKHVSRETCSGPEALEELEEYLFERAKTETDPSEQDDPSEEDDPPGPGGRKPFLFTTRVRFKNPKAASKDFVERIEHLIKDRKIWFTMIRVRFKDPKATEAFSKLIGHEIDKEMMV